MKKITFKAHSIEDVLVNAGKYATTFLVVTSNSINKWVNLNYVDYAYLSFGLWVFSYIVSFTYTFLWDIFMDWGLVSNKSLNVQSFLRLILVLQKTLCFYAKK